MALELPALEFATDSLEPYMSANTLNFHHGKHHNAYVVKANELLAAAGIESDDLEELVRTTANQKGPLFNNVGQHYNHSFFWNSLSPIGSGEPKGPIAEKISSDFGSFEAFKAEFIKSGVGQFGSGWVWLVAHEGKLKVVNSANAETPLTQGMTPILVCDVWEHAYYLDYQNRRPDFLTAFVDHLANWEFANKNLANG